MKKILVALDGSQRERGVLDAAIALARKTGARLVLFRSVGAQHDLPADVYSMPPDEIPRLLQRRALAAVEALARNVPEGVYASARAEIGIAWQAIQRAAVDEDADLIVIGSHGYDTLDRVIGTTAAKVVNHADRPVLVVRAPERITA